MGQENEDVITEEAAEALLPSYTKFYLDESYSEDGDLIRGIDTLGNAGFVRNVVEKARDHRSFRLDDEDLDAVLASDTQRIQRGSTAPVQGAERRRSSRGAQRGSRREEAGLAVRGYAR